MKFSPAYPVFFLAAVGAYLLVKPREAYAGDGAAVPYTPDIPEIYVEARPTSLLVLAQTIWGEARGEGYTGMQAVANVIVNRAALGSRGINAWWGTDIQTVCLCYRAGTYQFSCWNPRDPNRLAMVNATPADPAFAAALEIAGRALAGQLPDITNKATHYYAKSISAPYWAKNETVLADIGNHIFLAA